MKRAMRLAASAVGVALIMYAGIRLDRIWINHVTSKRTEQILADMQEQVDRAREINKQRANAVWWIADGDTMYLRGGEILDNPAVVGKPKRAGK